MTRLASFCTLPVLRISAEKFAFVVNRALDCQQRCVPYILSNRIGFGRFILPEAIPVMKITVAFGEKMNGTQAKACK
ncbi:MAG: hypothetical protein DI589_03815 [Shinella sp.]|nr:MAG: hypothetical protein DI589_03815 [Shinella sp.]